MDLTVLAAGPSLAEAKPLRESQKQKRTVMAEKGQQGAQLKFFFP